MLTDVERVVMENFSKTKVEIQMFKDYISVIDELYQASIEAVFRGILEVIEAKMAVVKTIKHSSQVVFKEQVNPTGKTIYFVSLFCRQIDFSSIFTNLCGVLSLHQAGIDSEAWQPFLQDKLPQIQDKFDLYSIHYRKAFIDHYDAQINQALVSYFSDLKAKQQMTYSSNEEPASISKDIHKIALIIHKQLFKELGLNFAKVENKITANIQQFMVMLEHVPKPHMLLQTQ